MTYPLYTASHTLLTTQQLCNLTATMSDITPTICVSSHPLDLFYQNKCMYDITATLCMTSYALRVTSHPLFRTSHHFLYDIRSTLSDLTSTVYLSIHPPYRWYYSHYMYDLTCSVSVTSRPLYYDIIYTKYDITTLCVDDAALGICMTSFALQMTTHPVYHTTRQYLWCHIHLRHDNTAPYQTSHPLYPCHHNLPSDISPTFVWHHTHLLCDIICTIDNITPNPYVITLLYLWHHNFYIWNHIQYVGQHIHYTWDITATICVLTPTV